MHERMLWFHVNYFGVKQYRARESVKNVAYAFMSNTNWRSMYIAAKWRKLFGSPYVVGTEIHTINYV